VDELYAIKKNLFLCYLVFDTSNLFTRLTCSLVYLLTMLLCLSSQATCSLVNSFTRLPS